MEADFQDSVVSSTQDIIKRKTAPTISGLRTTLQMPKTNKTKGAKDCVWLKNFFKTCQAEIGNTSFTSLVDNITYFTEKIAKHVAKSYSSPKKAGRLKVDMLLVLKYFHFQYMDTKMLLDDDSLYLERMSNLLTMYMDMEIKASRRGRESVKKITSKLVASLCLFLRSSTEHILNTILHSQFLMKCYHEIWIPIFKSVTNLPVTEDMTYVRFLLIFKLWKRFSAKGEEKGLLNEIATAKLPTVPESVLVNMQRGLFIKVLPLLPAETEPDKVTRFFMTTKFNVQESIKGFFNWIKDNIKEEEITTTDVINSRPFDDNESAETDDLLLFDESESFPCDGG